MKNFRENGAKIFHSREKFNVGHFCVSRSIFFSFFSRSPFFSHSSSCLSVHAYYCTLNYIMEYLIIHIELEIILIYIDFFLSVSFLSFSLSLRYSWIIAWRNYFLLYSLFQDLCSSSGWTFCLFWAPFVSKKLINFPKWPDFVEILKVLH